MRQEKQQQLIESINSIQILEGRDYGWLWEYSRFRFSHSSAGIKAAEDKGATLLKFTLSLAGAVWIVFTYLVHQLDLIPHVALNCWLIMGAVLLLCGFICAVCTLIPSKRLEPIREKAAVRFINENDKGSSKPLGRFALGLMLCSDYAESATTHISYLVIAGTVLLLLAFSLFIVGFCSYPFWLPNSNHRRQTEYLAPAVVGLAVVAAAAEVPAGHSDYLASLDSMHFLGS
jgi:hypothetical protein